MLVVSLVLMSLSYITIPKKLREINLNYGKILTITCIYTCYNTHLIKTIPASALLAGFWYIAFNGKPLSPGRVKLAIANECISFFPSTLD